MVEEETTNFQDDRSSAAHELRDATGCISETDRFKIFVPIRILIAIIGIIGNVLTLIIIKKLKVRSNGHFLMIYLVASDIAVCLVCPVVLFEMAQHLIIDLVPYWKELCIAANYHETSTTAACVTSYTFLSVDR